MGVVSGVVKENGTPVPGRVVRAYRRDTGALLGSAVSSDGVVIPGDPDYPSVALLLPLNGAAGGASFTDASAAPKTVTVAGSVAHSNEQTPFAGMTSAKFSGGASTLLASDSSFAFGTGNFTIEALVYLTSNDDGGFGNLATSSNSGGQGVAFWLTGAGSFRVRIGQSVAGQFDDIMGSGAFPTGVWRHVAVTRDGTGANGVKIWMHGELNAQGTSARSINMASFAVGRAYPSESSGGTSGYISNVRVTPGLARYTSAFTPPAAPFPTSLGGDPGPLGSYSISTSHTGEVQVVCLDDDAGTTYNDLIARTTPA